MLIIEERIKPLVRAVEAFTQASARKDRALFLAQLRTQLQEIETSDASVRAEFQNMQQTVPQSAELVPASRESERAAAAELIPRVVSLQGYLVGTSQSDDPEAHRVLQKAVNIAVAYVSGYQDLRDQLFRQEAEQPKGTDDVLLARPVKGEVDYAKLSREHIARYPKIRARLAE